MKPLRILVPFGGVAAYGSERATLRIMESLKRRGARLYIITREDACPPVKRIMDEMGVEQSVVVWGPLLGKNLMNPLELFSVFSGLVKTSLEVSRQVKKFKPTHLYFGNILYFFYSSLALVHLKIPIIYRLADPVPKKVYNFIFRRFIVNKTAHFVCNSQFIKQHALEKGISEKKLSVIYTPPPNDPPARISRRNPYRQGEEPFILSYIGQISRRKGVHCFIEMAIKILKTRQDIVFYIAGDVEYKNPFAKSEMARVQALGLNSRIVFLGFLEETDELYQATDILCVPSLWGEPLANIVLEAKVFGVPSVIFPDGGLPEMVEHQVDGFICKEKTAKALEEGVFFFLESESRLINAKKAARESLRKFDRDKITDEWLKVFEEAR